MVKRGKYIVDAPLIKDSFTFTIPKKVRNKLQVTRREFRVLSFMLEEDGEVSIGFGNGKVIGASEFIASFQVTVPKYAREVLELEKGDSVGFWEDNELILMRKMI